MKDKTLGEGIKRQELNLLFVIDGLGIKYILGLSLIVLLLEFFIA